MADKCDNIEAHPDYYKYSLNDDKSPQAHSIGNTVRKPAAHY